VIDRFTENVDIVPTVCEAMEVPIPAQCDGYPLTPFLDGAEPPAWREAAWYEWDWRDQTLELWGDGRPWDRRLERQHLAVRRSADRAFVQFGSGDWRCLDLAADPTWRTEITDPAVVLDDATKMLTWRGSHLDRTMTGMLLREGGVGRIPEPAPFLSRSRP
jgi:arylsulfatase A-like enzyme